jgi:hypothetical protein
LYQGKPIDEQLINDVYNLYSKYKSDQKKDYNSKPKFNLDSTNSNLIDNIHSLEDKIKHLEQRIVQLNSYVMDIISEVPVKNKSFLHKIFNK